MFRIDKDQNSIEALTARSFGELNFKERGHLQEWVEKNPSCLGEDLLIIQKEFSGFSDTRERLDLLALDKEGRVVIIENKLDDTGRDVIWQALKYASYCSSLKTQDIRGMYQEYLRKKELPADAGDEISAFLGVDDFSDVSINRGISQRIIFIAANFRKEATSTVLWLLNFKLKIQCFKITPWEFRKELFLNIEQIIPVPDSQDYMINLAEKAQDEARVDSSSSHRHATYQDFWGEMINAMQKSKSKLFNENTAIEDNWIRSTSGERGVGFMFRISKSYGRAEIYIDGGDKQKNKKIFDFLYDQRNEIEENFDGSLEWERRDNFKSSRIKTEISANVFVREDWPEMIEFMTDAMVKMEQAFGDSISKIKTIQ